MGKNGSSNSGLGGFVHGGSIRFSKYKQGSGGVDAWRDQLSQAKQHQSSARPRTFGTKIPKLHSVHEANIVSVQSFGVFCQLGKGDVYKDGMLHVSNVGQTRIESPQEAGLEMGQTLYVKVNDISDKEFKYGLDMRFVSQQTGKDLDPYNGKSKVPDNHWYKGVFAQFIPKAEPEEEEPIRPPSPAAMEPVKDKKRKEAPGSESDGSDVSSDVAKKLKKAKKKLEKMRKKAEKAKKKSSKKDGKKDKKTKNSSESNGSAGGSSG